MNGQNGARKLASSRAETLTQVALLQSLLQGDYYGSLALGELKQYGDTGIGTFDTLDGELVMVDGVIYSARGDGSVDVVPDEVTTPFANVAFLRPDRTCAVSGVGSFDDLVSLLDEQVALSGANHPHIVRVDGLFNRVYVRSVYAQREPYRTLVEALAADQTFFTYEHLEGTVVALYFPPYMRELNNAGWHLHFVSSDGTRGGHVLDLAIASATVTVDCKRRFEMVLPTSDSFFDGIDFTKDRSDEVRKAETNQ